MLEDLGSATLAQSLSRWEDLRPLLGAVAPRFLQALMVAFLTLYVARWSRRATLRGLAGTKSDVNTRYLLARLVSFGVVFLGFATILAIFDVPLSAVVTLVGVVGLAISLALQDILKNVFSGLYLLLERPFRIGDDIRVRDFAGRVEDIGMRTTTLRTLDNMQILIPNALVFAEVITNRTHARVDLLAEQPAAQVALAAQEARTAAAEVFTGEGQSSKQRSGGDYHDRHAADSLPDPGQ